MIRLLLFVLLIISFRGAFSQNELCHLALFEFNISKLEFVSKVKENPIENLRESSMNNNHIVKYGIGSFDSVFVHYIEDNFSRVIFYYSDSILNEGVVKYLSKHYKLKKETDGVKYYDKNKEQYFLSNQSYKNKKMYIRLHKMIYSQSKFQYSLEIVDKKNRKKI